MADRACRGQLACPGPQGGQLVAVGVGFPLGLGLQFGAQLIRSPSASARKMASVL
jgi:hypothetical protein